MKLFVKSTKRVVIGCLCGAGALAAVACGDGRRVPTSPSASPSPSGTVSNLAATAPVNVGTALETTLGAKPAKTGKPFKGSFTIGEGTAEFIPPSTLHVQFPGTGNATHLGRFTATFDIQIDVSHDTTQTSVGTLNLIAANGDRVFTTLVGAATIAGDIASIVETCTITGGTGRFADATGSFVIERFTNLVTGAAPPGSFNGSIGY